IAIIMMVANPISPIDAVTLVPNIPYICINHLSMQRLVFWLIYPFLLLISYLPFRLFYIFSDLVFILVYYILNYRKKTVLENLELVFPEKSKQELKNIRKKFYHHMCDMFLEMV